MKKDSKTPELPAKEPTAAAIEPEVVMPPEPVPRQPDLPAGGTPVDDGKVAAALSEAWRVAKRVEAHAVVAALRFGAAMAVAERAVGDGRGRGRKNEGFKGWLAKRCPEICYRTALRWRKLACAAAAMMRQEPERLRLTLDDKWWARNGGGQPRALAAQRGKLFKAESMRALAALVFDYKSEDRKEGREEGSKNVERTDADRAREDWGVWTAGLSDAWALKSVPFLAIDEARTAYNAMKPLVAALKRRLDEEE